MKNLIEIKLDGLIVYPDTSIIIELVFPYKNCTREEVIKRLKEIIVDELRRVTDVNKVLVMLSTWTLLEASRRLSSIFCNYLRGTPGVYIDEAIRSYLMEFVKNMRHEGFSAVLLLITLRTLLETLRGFLQTTKNFVKVTIISAEYIIRLIHVDSKIHSREVYYYIFRNCADVIRGNFCRELLRVGVKDLIHVSYLLLVGKYLKSKNVSVIFVTRDRELAENARIVLEQSGIACKCVNV